MAEALKHPSRRVKVSLPNLRQFQRNDLALALAWWKWLKEDSA